jgi:DNA-binding transcriptional LysR family regulator
MRLRVQTAMELDSQEAIIHMVSGGLGVAVVPLSARDLEYLQDLDIRPFGEPQGLRQVVLLEREDRPVARLAAALAQAIRNCRSGGVTDEK